MIDCEFAIGTYEIELLNKLDRAEMFTSLDAICSYIDTAINYNNDYLLTETRQKIISKISACHYDAYEFMVSNHLKYLRRDFIDVMLIHSNRGNWQQLAAKIKDDKRFKHLGVSNFMIDDILEYEKIVGRLPEYCELEINPQYVDVKTIEFCKAHDIKIIAYAILGGKYRAMRNIATYSLPYLISFAATFANVLILRADSKTQANAFFDVARNYKLDKPIEINNITHNKAIEPMRYQIPDVAKKFCGELTYHNTCGRNNDIVFVSKERVNVNFPEFEMLGDYKTFIRYVFGGTNYVYDFLRGKDKRLYAVYLFDKQGRLTKVNDGNVDVQVYKFEVRI